MATGACGGRRSTRWPVAAARAEVRDRGAETSACGPSATRALRRPLGGRLAERVRLVVVRLRVLHGHARPVLRSPSGRRAPLPPQNAPTGRLAADHASILGLTPASRLVGPLEEWPADVVTDLERMLDEALTNVARHARATRADITVRVVGGTITLQVTDDGIGPCRRAEGRRVGRPAPSGRLVRRLTDAGAGPGRGHPADLASALAPAGAPRLRILSGRRSAGTATVSLPRRAHSLSDLGATGTEPKVDGEPADFERVRRRS